MSTDLDHTTRLLERSLNQHADDAPSDGPLLTTVRARLRRRRTVRTVGAAVLASVSVAAAIAVATAIERETLPVNPTVARAPDGLRWESYGGLEVLVPATWGYAADPSQPCLAKPGVRPFVRRPGMLTTGGCAGRLSALNARASYVWFDSGQAAGRKAFDHGWAWETRVVAGTPLTVLSDDAALRRTILDSARAISGTDVYGCAPSHAVAFRPTERPEGDGLGSVGRVESVSVCSYSFASPEPDPPPPLYSSRLFTGTAASDLVEAMTSAPEGTGPNHP